MPTCATLESGDLRVRVYRGRTPAQVSLPHSPLYEGPTVDDLGSGLVCGASRRFLQLQLQASCLHV